MNSQIFVIELKVSVFLSLVYQCFPTQNKKGHYYEEIIINA